MNENKILKYFRISITLGLIIIALTVFQLFIENKRIEQLETENQSLWKVLDNQNKILAESGGCSCE